MSDPVAIDDDRDLDDPSDESEDDTQGRTGDPADAVVSGTDWTAETLLNQLRRGNIELNPSFQRRDAWTVERKSRFIESLIAGIPIPQVVLAEKKSHRGTYIVIDGKQRLLSLAQFAGYAPESIHNRFALGKLTLRAGLNGSTYDSLTDDPTATGELNALENSTIRTVVIKNWPSAEYLYLVFHRLNTGSVPLSPQELRQALYPGPFTEFVDAYSFDSNPLKLALGTRGKDFRMRDAELLVRAFAFEWFLSDYAGNLKQFLDLTCERLNASWEKDASAIEAQAAAIDEAILACRDIFEDFTFRRVLSSGEPESRFNRAIFDTQMLFMSRPHIRDLALADRDRVKDAYIKLGRSRGFSEATGSTTKSIGATSSRLSLWASSLRKTLGGQVPEVSLSTSNRIRIE